MGRAAGEKVRGESSGPFHLRLNPEAQWVGRLEGGASFHPVSAVDALFNQFLDVLAVLRGPESRVLHRATKSHVVPQIFRAVRIGQEVIHVDLPNLVLTGDIATVVG